MTPTQPLDDAGKKLIESAEELVQWHERKSEPCNCGTYGQGIWHKEQAQILFGEISLDENGPATIKKMIGEKHGT